MSLIVSTWSLMPTAGAVSCAATLPAFAAGQPQPSDEFVWATSCDPVPRSPFLLAPGAERYFTGMLSEVSGGTLVLGIAAYLGGGHRMIARTIERNCGYIEKFLWAGEIFCRGSKDGLPCASALKLNETSGFLQESRNVSKVAGIFGRYAGGGLEELKRMITSEGRLMPFPVAEDAEFVPFDAENPHLDPRLKRLYGTRNVRHDTCSSVTGVIQNTRLCLDWSRGGVRSEDQIKRIFRVIEKRYASFLVLREMFLRDDPSLAGKLDGMIPFDEIMESGGEEFVERLEALHRSAVVLDQFLDDGFCHIFVDCHPPRL